MSIRYHVVPRYTPGSSGQLDEAHSRRIAAQELAAYNRHIDGMYGPYEKQRAIEKGLEGIVYSVQDRRGKKFIIDLLTHAEFVVPIKEWTGQHWGSRTDRHKYIQPANVS